LRGASIHITRIAHCVSVLAFVCFLFLPLRACSLTRFCTYVIDVSLKFRRKSRFSFYIEAASTGKQARKEWRCS
jgi:hypothetical protein